MFAIDLNAELKSRLKKSTHASVGNLKKSATISNATLVAEPLSNALCPSTSTASISAASSQDLGKLLRSLPRRDAAEKSDDAATVNQALAGISKRLQKAAVSAPSPTSTTEDDDDADARAAPATSDDGESSGGREVKTIISNTAVARRKKFNDG